MTPRTRSSGAIWTEARISGALRVVNVIVGLVAAFSTACIAPSERRVASCEGIGFSVGCGDKTCGPSETASSCPSDCSGAAVQSYNGQTVCTSVTRVELPESTQEVAAVVRRALAQGQQVRVIGRRHSSNAQLCSTGTVISTERLDAAISIETFEGVETVLTEPGIRYGDLTRWLDERGRSLGYAVLGTRDPSIAGAIATGSHGSSPRHPSVISSRLQWVELVDAQGEVQEYSRQSTPPALWKTLTASLGLAGIVTRLRLRVEPTFSLDVQVTYHSDAALGRGEGPIEMVRECDYGQLVWFPGQKRVVKMCGKRSTLPRQRGATNRLLEPDFRQWMSGPAERALHYGTCNERFNCKMLERTRLQQFERDPPFFWAPTSDAPKRSAHALVGAGYAMMSSELTSTQEGILQHDFEFALPPDRAAEVL